MGRRIYENGNFVWKYVFGAQPSEQYRIYEQFGIGEYEEDEQCDSLDYLTLTTEDISDLEEILTIGEYQNKKQKFEELAKEYEGLHLYFSDQDNKEIHVNPFEEGKTEQELIELYEAKGYTFRHSGIACGSPYDDKSVNFARQNDYYFLEMVQAFIDYMKKIFEEDGQDMFTFEGEIY